MSNGPLSIPVEQTPPVSVGNKEIALDSLDVAVISYVDQLFWETGKIPSVEKVAAGLKLLPSKVKPVLEKPQVLTALKQRGVNFEQDIDSKVLTPKQVMLANILMNIYDKSSVRQKLKSLNISTQQYNAWMRQPAFRAYMQKRAEEIHSSADVDGYLELSRLVQEGDLSAIKFHFEMRGIYTPRQQIEVNVTSVIAQLLEIIQRHVTDKDTLIRIAADVDALAIASGKFKNKYEDAYYGDDDVIEVDAMPIASNVELPAESEKFDPAIKAASMDNKPETIIAGTKLEDI